MDKEWITLIKQAKEQGMSQSEVRQRLSHQSAKAKFIYETNDTGQVLNRILQVDDIDDISVISMSVSYLRQHYTSRKWHQDEEMREIFDKIVAVDNVLNGSNRKNNEYRKVGE